MYSITICVCVMIYLFFILSIYQLFVPYGHLLLL